MLAPRSILLTSASTLKEHLKVAWVSILILQDLSYHSGLITTHILCYVRGVPFFAV
ncbi:MAG: hypothetical protein ACI8SK_000502 [Shewanella sp.]|jgi:hypothetical protein